MLTLKLFAEHPDVLAGLPRSKYRYVMVDEYQDTNAAQFQLVHHLTAAHRNLCVVGDDDQSIYGWRGAETANLLELEKHFPGVKVVKLEQNYRSTNTILSAANAIIKNNARRRGKQLWSQNGAGRADHPAHAFPSDEEEARRMAEEIEFARLARRVPWREQAILFRTNQQSRPLETALRQAGVRYHLVGGQSYFDRREIKDFLAYLKMLVNPNDDISLLRIANVPARGLSDVTMERLLAGQPGAEMPGLRRDEAHGRPGRLSCPTRARRIATLHRIGRAPARPVARAPGRFAVGVGAGVSWRRSVIEAELRRGEKNPETADNRIGNLRELTATLPGNGGDPERRLQNFLDDLSLDSDREEEKENTGRRRHADHHSQLQRAGVSACPYRRPGGRPVAALPLEGRGHDGRGAPAILRGRDARDANADPEPLRHPEKIRQRHAMPPVAVPPRNPVGIPGNGGGQGKGTRNRGSGQGRLRGHADGSQLRR